MAQIDVSVIVCCHNSRPDYLRRTLEGLAAQTFPLERWELLLIDNASDQPIEESVDLGWHPSARCEVEKRKGQTFARMHGICIAKGKTLIFVDDDNLLDGEYLAQASRIAEEYPWLGAWGGSISPEFESEPPAWTKPYWRYLAVRPVEHDVWSNALSFETSPVGAGMVVRASVAREYAMRTETNPTRQILGRKGSALTSGDDSDLAFTALDFGLGTGLFAALRMTHIIPQQRLEPRYLSRLLEGISYSSAIVLHLHGKKQSMPKKSRMQKLFDWYLRQRMNPIERTLCEASERGARAALIELEKNDYSPPSGDSSVLNACATG